MLQRKKVSQPTFHTSEWTHKDLVAETTLMAIQRSAVVAVTPLKQPQEMGAS
jgi:hypothetical protein